MKQARKSSECNKKGLRIKNIAKKGPLMLQKMSISYILSLVLYSHHTRDMSKSIHKAHSSWQTFFSIAFFVVLLMVAATIFYRIKIASLENKIADISVTIKEVEKKIAAIEKEPGYNKL